MNEIELKNQVDMMLNVISACMSFRGGFVLPEELGKSNVREFLKVCKQNSVEIIVRTDGGEHVL